MNTARLLHPSQAVRGCRLRLRLLGAGKTNPRTAHSTDQVRPHYIQFPALYTRRIGRVGPAYPTPCITSIPDARDLTTGRLTPAFIRKRFDRNIPLNDRRIECMIASLRTLKYETQNTEIQFKLPFLALIFWIHARHFAARAVN